MSGLADFRREYPQYDDISDKDLADSLHEKYYSDIPISEFYATLGVDDTSMLGALGEAGKRLVGGLATGTARVGTGLAELIPGVDDEAAREVQQDVDEFVADKLAYDPAYDESYLAQLGEVVGEMGPMVGSLFLPGGIPARVTQLATMIGPAVSEGGMDRAEYEERTGEALSTAERLTAKGADVGLGMLERLGIPSRILKGLPRGFFDRPEANPFLRRIESMVISAGQEGVQEVGQGIARDLTTLAIYDPDRKIADSVIEDFTLGGGAGAVLDLVVGLAQTPLKGRKGRAPKPIEEMTEEEIADEEAIRERFEQAEQARRADMDQTLGAVDIGPQMPPEVREDPIDPTAVDTSLPVEDMAGQVVTRLGSRLPVGKVFGVGSLDNQFFAEIDGEQFGPALDDPTVAQELANRLTDASQRLAKRSGVEYVVESSGIEYTEQQADEVRRLGRSIPSPQERIISAEDANLATGRDIASVINQQKADRGEAEAEVFTLEEVRAANKGDLGNLGDVLAAKDADFLAFGAPEPVTPSTALDPTRPRQPALGRQQALAAFSGSFDNVLSSNRAFADLFARKRFDTTVDSEAFRGLIKRIIGKTPSKKDPLDNLTPNERRYLYHRVRKLPSFQEQATPIPDFSTKTPDGELVRIARRQIEVDQPPRMAVEATAFGQTGQPPSQAEVRRVEAEARRTARPIERAEEGVPEGQELVPYDLDQSALGQQLRDALRKFGIDDQYATRMVERVGNARRDSDGNIYIMPIKQREDGKVVAGSAQSGAKVIQVGLDAVMADVNSGATYEQAVARIMNHEILHALRAMDLFTAEEYSLLERLSRKYQKPGEGKTYGQWAVDSYGDIGGTRLQEEAIAEMISDALTTGVVMDGDVKKPTGKPRAIFNKIINFFKGLVGFAKDNDIQSFKNLVDNIQSGVVGRRERGVVRTPFRTEQAKGEVPERGITTEDVGLETGKRGRRLTPRQVINTVKQNMGDAPEVDEAMLSLRLDRAAEQGFDTSAVYYHGSMSPDIKRFKARTGMGVVAGHFTLSPKLANAFVADVAREGETATVYPVFLRKFIDDNETGKSLFAVREAGEVGALQNIGDSIDKSFAEMRFDHPQLFQDLTNYFKGQLELAKQNGSVEGTKLRYGLSQSIAQEYVQGKISLDEAAYDIAENFHENAAPNSFRQINEEPYEVDFEQLEALAPYIKEAGFAGYRDIEFIGDSYSAVALFDPADVKGVFAEYDPTAIPEGARYEDDIMFSLRSAVDMFAPSAFDYPGATGRETLDPKQINPANKARHTVVDMPIDMFLGLAQVGESAFKTKGVQELVEKGVQFDELPMLITRAIDSEEFGPVLFVGGHEGRHRARALKAAGYDTMPVRIWDDYIRWGEQDNPKSLDYMKFWPEKIIAEADVNRTTDPSKAGYQPRGLYAYPMFISRDGAVNFQPAIERPSVIFEVAPDPRNTPLLEQWNSLPEADKLEISEQVARDIAPSVLAEVSASGEVVSQIGSYKNETNPSFAVRLSSGDPTDAASVLGFVLQQESMMIVSPRPYEGAQSRLDPDLGTETRSIPAIFIKVDDKSQAEIAQIYDTLRTADGAPEFSGQSTIDGNMMILLDGSPDVDAAVAAFDKALGGQYAIDDTVVFSSFPQAKDYNYETEVLNTRVSPEGARRRLNNVRAQAQAEVKRRVQESRDRLDRRSNRGDILERLSGAVRPNGQLSLTHYSRQPIRRTDPSRAGTGADRTRKFNRVSSATYLGITEANINPYVREPMLGNVANRFEVDPFSLYDLDRNTESLAKKNPDGSWDLDGTLKAVSEAGYIGFWTDNPTLGKVALVTEPLEAVKDKPVTKDIQTKVTAPRQTVTPQQADQAVDNNIASIADNPTGVPRFSAKASPEAQYIAQNPEKGLPSDDPMFSVRGDIPAVDKLTRGPDREAPNGRVFMEATNTGPIRTILTKLKAGALNRYAALEKYYQKVPQLRELEAESSAIAAALFSDRSKAILASAVKYGVPVYRDGLTRVEEFTHDGETYRGLIGVMSLIYNKDVGDLRKLAQAYAMVQRGDYLTGKGKLTPVDPKSRKEVLDAVDALTDADGYNPVKKWHEVWSAYNNRTIDFLKATGILNDETAEVWKGSSYIPFYRTGVSEDALPSVAKGVFGDMTRMSEFRAYQGSDKAVDVGLIESVVLNMSAAIDMGMKNVAQQRIARDMQNMGLARQLPFKPEPKGRNTVTFKVNGKPVRFEIDDNLIYDSMTSLGAGTVEDLAVKYLGIPSNVLRELVTRDPGFMIANMMRDTLSTWTTSGASFVPVLDTVKGLGGGIERLEKLGVVGGYDFSIDKKDIVKFYEAENKRRNTGTTPLNMFGRIWNWAGQATTASDAATRNAVYEDVLARTGNEAEAAFQAMEIINFARRGSHPMARILTAAIPFLNARFQGLDVFWRSAFGNYTTRRDEPPAKGQLRLLYRGGILAGLTALYYLLVSDEDWYNEQDDYVRELNWLVPTESGVPMRIPIPFEVGLVFKTVPEAILASTYGDQSDRELRQTLQRGLVSTLEINPLGVQAISPLVEASLNHSFFTGREIVPYYLNKQGAVTAGLTGGANNTQIATDVGKLLNISPMKIDHVIFGYTGTIGSYLISSSDALYKQMTGAEDKRPAKTIFQFPLWKRFFASKEGTGLKADAYDLYNDVSEVVATINKLQKEGRIDELQAYLASRQHVLDLKSPVYSMKRQLDKLRQQKQRIISSDMDAEVKRQMIEDLDANMNEYLKVVPRLKELADAPFIQTTF